MVKLNAGTIHNKISPEMKQVIIGANLTETWQSLTPLMRNEWICWVESPKQETTRQKHLIRLVEDLGAGKRRPCCWIGCIHRTDKPISLSVKGILAKQNRQE